MNEQELDEFAGEEISALLLPVGDKKLLLPNVSVAEIISYTRPKSVENRPTWLLGTVDWRGVAVPLVDFEVLNGSADSPNPKGRRIAILNSVTGNPTLPFCGIVMTGIPRLHRVLPAEISEDGETPCGTVEMQSVIVSGEWASIPDLQQLQESVSAVL